HDALPNKPNKGGLVERELLWEAAPVDDSRCLVRLALLQQHMRQEADVVRPGHAHTVRDGEIDRLPQIGDRGTKIATIRLALAAPEQQVREVEDLPAAVGLRDRLVKDGNGFVEPPRPE